MDGDQRDILQSAPTASKPKSSEAKRGRGVSFVLGFFLFIGLVTLGERLIYDLNRYVNPYTCPVSSGYSYNYNNNTRGGTAISADERLAQCGNYKVTRLLIILALVVPVVIGGFVIYFRFAFRHLTSNLSLAWSFMGFAFWMFGHLFVEVAHFLLLQYSAIGIYVVLVLSIALLGGLTWALQRYRQNAAVPQTPNV